LRYDMTLATQKYDTMTLKEKKLRLDAVGKTATIYCDMDGVLAKWEVGCPYERTREPGYFFTLELEPEVKKALLLLKDAGFNVCILSAAYEDGTARKDKARWLEKFGLGDMNRLFVPVRQNKANFIDVLPGNTYILLDDFNFNLIEWDATKKNDGNFIAVKFLNGINGGGDTWKGRTLSVLSDGEEIAHQLADIAIKSFK